MKALLCLFLTLSAASAAVINVTISPSLLVGNPGQAVTFTGTLENLTGDTVYINSNSFTFDIAGVGVLDDSLFLSNAPFFLNAFETTVPFDFLAVNVPMPQAPGFYSGVLTVLGGADGLASDILGSGSFQLEVPKPAAAGPEIPEPSTVLLMSGGLALLWWKRRR